MSEREEQRQGKHHDNPHDDLQRQPDFHVIHKGVLSRRHHQGIGRSGERRSETHAGRHRHRKQERHGTDTYLQGALQGYRSHQHSSHRIADEHRHQRSGEVNAGHQRHRPVGAQTADQRAGDVFRGARLLQRNGHGQHPGEEHDGFPIDGLIGRLNVAEATGQHHQHGRNHHSRDGRHGDEVEHHHRHHQQHDSRGHGRLVVQRHLGCFLQRLSQHHPIRAFSADTGDVLPRALHQQHVAAVHPLAAQVLQQVFFLAADAQHIDVELVAESGLLHPLVHYVRRGGQQDFRDADVIEVQRMTRMRRHLCVMPVHQFQAEVFDKTVDIGGRAIQIQDVACLDHRVRRSQPLRHGLQEAVLRSLATTHLQNVQAITPPHVQSQDGLPHNARRGNGPQAEKIGTEAIFFHQFIQRFTGGRRAVLLPLLGQEPSGQGQQHDDARQHAQQPHGQERKKAQRLIARLGQHFINDQIGRRTDERHHAAHAAGKSQRHQQAGRLRAGIECQAHHNRQHQGHRTRIADKGPDGRGGQHDQQEQLQFALSGQLQQARTDHLGQSRLKDGTPHHKETHHHDHDGVGEAGQSFFGCQDVKHKHGNKGAQRHDVRTDFARNEKRRRERQDKQGRQHDCSRIFLCAKVTIFRQKSLFLPSLFPAFASHSPRPCFL